MATTKKDATPPVAAALKNALPELVRAEQQLRKLAAAQGVQYRIADFGGLRTLADTTRILKYRSDDYAAAVKADKKVALIPMTEWRPIAPFGSSLHNYGAAFDVRPSQWPANRSAQWAINTVRDLAPKAGLRVLNTKNDPWHFELPLSLEAARRRWMEFSGKPHAGHTPPETVVALALVALILGGAFLLLGGD